MSTGGFTLKQRSGTWLVGRGGGREGGREGGRKEGGWGRVDGQASRHTHTYTHSIKVKRMAWNYAPRLILSSNLPFFPPSLPPSLPPALPTLLGNVDPRRFYSFSYGQGSLASNVAYNAEMGKT